MAGGRGVAPPLSTLPMFNFRTGERAPPALQSARLQEGGEATCINSSSTAGSRPGGLI
ncbi:hypothetical protein CRUP_022625 [Coryphaenoides rupestris]|nr:hypothetical protein CRUP_022625 [Coryphaenoides rupestris]